MAKEIDGIYSWIRIETKDLARAEKAAADYEKKVLKTQKEGRQQQAKFEQQYSDVMSKEYVKRKTALEKALKAEVDLIKKTYSGAKLPAISDAIKKFRTDLENLNKTAVETKGKFGGQGLFGNLVATGAAIGGIAAIRSAITSMIGASSKAESAVLGLAAVVKNKLGAEAIPEATRAVEKLSATGIMSSSGAGQAMKNLIAMGYSIEQATEFLEANAKMATVSRQSHYSLEESIVVVTEGLKNQNSVLTDATGLSTNLSVILKKAGFDMADLDDATKGAAARQAILNAFVKEGSQYTDVAAKKMAGYEGQTAKLDAAITKVSASGGDMLKTFLTPFISIAQKVISYIADLSDTAKIIGGVTAAVAAMIPIMSAAIPLVSSFWVAVTGPVGVAAAVVASLGAMSVAIIDWMDKVDKAQQQHQKVSAQAGLNRYMTGQSAPNAIAAQVLGGQTQAGGVSQQTAQSMRAIQTAAAAATPAINTYAAAIGGVGAASQKAKKDTNDLLAAMKPADKTIENLTTKSKKAAEEEKKLGEQMEFAAKSAERLADAVGNKSASGFSALALSIAKFAQANPILIGVLAGVSAAFAIYEKWFAKKEDEVTLNERLLKQEQDKQAVLQNQLRYINEAYQAKLKVAGLENKGVAGSLVEAQASFELTKQTNAGVREQAKALGISKQPTAADVIKVNEKNAQFQVDAIRFASVIETLNKIGLTRNKKQIKSFVMQARSAAKEIQDPTIRGYVTRLANQYDNILKLLNAPQSVGIDIALAQESDKIQSFIKNQDSIIGGLTSQKESLQALADSVSEVGRWTDEVSNEMKTAEELSNNATMSVIDATKASKQLGDALSNYASQQLSQSSPLSVADNFAASIAAFAESRTKSITESVNAFVEDFLLSRELSPEEYSIQSEIKRVNDGIQQATSMLIQATIDGNEGWILEIKNALSILAEEKRIAQEALDNYKKAADDIREIQTDGLAAATIDPAKIAQDQIRKIQEDTALSERLERLQTAENTQMSAENLVGGQTGNEITDRLSIWQRALARISEFVIPSGLTGEALTDFQSQIQDISLTARENIAKIKQELGDIKIDQTINNNIQNYNYENNGTFLGPQEWLEKKVIGTIRDWNRISGGRLIGNGRNA